MGSSPEYSREYNRRWREKNPTYHRDWQRANRDRLIEAERAVRYEALSHYGGSPPQCACCGEAHIPFLVIDHVNGGGGKHRISLGNMTGSRFCRWLRRNGWPGGYRVLCWNCNSALGLYGECPHERERAADAPS